MRRLGMAFFLLGSSLWLLGADCVQAETRQPSRSHGTEVLTSRKHAHIPHVYERRATVWNRGPSRELSFEVLRMLSTGMTKAEVLSRAGPPRYGFKNRGTQRWVYASTDNWIVEIAFGGDRVTEINWSRSRP